jgi:hypothetical protein
VGEDDGRKKSPFERGEEVFLLSCVTFPSLPLRGQSLHNTRRPHVAYAFHDLAAVATEEDERKHVWEGQRKKQS